MNELSVDRIASVHGKVRGKTVSWIACFLLFGSVAISYHVFPGVSIAQLVWALSAAIVVCMHPFMSQPILRYFGVFVFAGLFSTLTGLIFAPVFGYYEALISSGNLLFYFICSLVLGAYLSKQGYERISKIASMLILFLSFTALFQYIYVVAIGGTPAVFDWPGHFIGNPYGWSLRGHFRAAGIFGEPSWLGLYLVLLLAYITIKPPNKWPLAPLIFGSLAIAVSFSAGAYALLGVLCIFQLPRIIRNMRRRRLWCLVFIFCGLGLIFGAVIQEVVVMRFDPSTLISEGSGRDRLVGSWEMAFTALREFSFAGVGLGNLDLFYEHVRGELKWKANPRGMVASAFAYVLATTGIIGILAFLYAVWKTYCKARRQYSVLVYMAVFWLTFLLLWNMVLSVAFWLFLILGTTVLPLQQGRRQSCVVLHERE